MKSKKIDKETLGFFAFLGVLALIYIALRVWSGSSLTADDLWFRK